MTMNSSGPISLGGTTAGQSIEIENGGPGTAQISLNDTAVRNLAGVPGSGTTIIMPTNFYGKSNRVALVFTLSSNTYNYDVYSAASSNPSYVSGKTDVTVNINPAVQVGSTAVGSYAMLVPASFGGGDTVTIVNNGYIVGTGGGGGVGSNARNGTGGGGSAGGNALYVARPTTVTNNGTVGAGGGGGGGGAGTGSNSNRGQFYVADGGGGGGGAGYNSGSGGAGGSGGGPQGSSPGQPGGTGSLTGGGGGGTGGPNNGILNGDGGPGGAGGGLGSAGAAGNLANASVNRGAGGPGGGSANYITGNSFVTWPSNGTQLGGVA